METLIEDKIIDVITKATIDEVQDYHPMNIGPIIEDEWTDLKHYPSIVVDCYRSEDIEKQIQAVTKRYYATVYIFIASASYDEARTSMRILKRRVEYTLRKYQRLENLTDTDIKESVFNMEIKSISFWSEGYTKKYLSVVRFDLEIDSDRTGPFT